MHLHFLGQVVLIFWVRSSSFCGSGHSLHLMIKEMFIILVNTRTLLENSTFYVLKYNKVSKNPKVFTIFYFSKWNSRLSPVTQVSWFLIECQYLLTWLFYQGHFLNYLVNPSIIQVITSFDAGKYLYDAGIYQWCAGFPLFAHTDWVKAIYMVDSTRVSLIIRQPTMSCVKWIFEL